MPGTYDLHHYYAAYSPSKATNLAPGTGSRYPLARKVYHRLSGDVDPRDFVQVARGARVLDYGCGQAPYLADFHFRGVRMAGAEIAGHLVEAYQQSGYEVALVEDMNRIPYPDEEFETVYLMQVIEHVQQPHPFFRELSRVLKSPGDVYMAMPNSRSFWRRIFGRRWVSGWFAPFHLFHYDLGSLEVLVSAHGFKVIDSWSSTPESWFRLNLKAALLRSEDQLETAGTKWVDVLPVRLLLMTLLRVIELFVRERDCLVVRLSNDGRELAGPGG
jgi:2-polyprenyl-3-methyl-5-hydroxy-6-metoxy-1,4-benzoquinol methylase